MDLWIRSQNRMKLTKVDTIELCEKVDGTWFLNSGDNLGTYKTKERALEILDDIQNLLETTGTDVSQMVYNMPEK